MTLSLALCFVADLVRHGAELCACIDVFTPEEWNIYRSQKVKSGTPLGVRCLDLRILYSRS